MTAARSSLAVLAMAATCVGIVRAVGCSAPLDCARTLTWPMLATSLAALATILAVAWALRSSWLLAKAARAVGALRMESGPESLHALARQLGADRPRYVATTANVAFCAGALRPRVYISHGLATSASADALSAIIAHEDHHRRGHHPLRRAGRRALSDVLFVAPVLRWWSERRIEHEELSADAAALRHVPCSVLADALLVAGGDLRPAAAAAFDGALEHRVAHLLGEPTARRRCPLGLQLLSAAGTTGLLALTVCVGEMIGLVR